jgi:hypothetical protein
MLSSGNYTSAYNYFVRNVIDAQINSGKISTDHLRGLQKADEKGFYARVLLDEYKIFSEKYYGTTEENDYLQETAEFYRFIYNIATRKPGDDATRLLFVSNSIKIGIVFIAKRDTLESYFGLDSYTHRVDLDFNHGAIRVYLFVHRLLVEESEVDAEGYVIKINRKVSFKYMDYIENRLLENNNYLIKKTDIFEVNIDGFKKMSKLLIVEKKDPAIITDIE